MELIFILFKNMFDCYLSLVLGNLHGNIVEKLLPMNTTLK